MIYPFEKPVLIILFWTTASDVLNMDNGAHRAVQIFCTR
jgi:hypothetical protein